MRGRSASASLNPQDLYHQPTWGLLAQTHLPGLLGRTVYQDTEEPNEEHLCTELATADGSSWALVAHNAGHDGHETQQLGSHRIWDELEQLHHRWTASGKPDLDRFGITIHRDDTTQPRLWLDDPETESTWAYHIGSNRLPPVRLGKAVTAEVVRALEGGEP